MCQWNMLKKNTSKIVLEFFITFNIDLVENDNNIFDLSPINQVIQENKHITLLFGSTSITNFVHSI